MNIVESFQTFPNGPVFMLKRTTPEERSKSIRHVSIDTMARIVKKSIDTNVPHHFLEIYDGDDVIHPVFDKDADGYTEKPDETECMRVLETCLECIRHLFFNVDEDFHISSVCVASRAPRQTKNGWKISYRFYVPAYSIKPNNLKRYIRFCEQEDFWDMSVYNKTDNLLYIIGSNKFGDTPTLLPINNQENISVFFAAVGEDSNAFNLDEGMEAMLKAHGFPEPKIDVASSHHHGTVQFVRETLQDTYSVLGRDGRFSTCPKHGRTCFITGETHRSNGFFIHFLEDGNVLGVCLANHQGCSNSKILGRWKRWNEVPARRSQKAGCLIDEELAHQPTKPDMKRLTKQLTLDEIYGEKKPPFDSSHLSKDLRETMFPTMSLEDAGIEHVVYSNRYVETFWECHGTGVIYYILKSHLGTGKTTVIRLYIKTHKPKSVLILSPRMIFASSIFLEFKKLLPQLVLYNECPDGSIDKPFVVCQMESIHRLTRDQYDLVIIDECESNLTQFKSSTMHHLDDCIARFQHYVQRATVSIWADAFITDKTLETVLSLSKRKDTVRYIENVYSPYDRRAVEIHSKFTFIESLKECLEAGQKVVCPIGSKIFAKEVFAAIQKCPGKKLLIVSDGDDIIPREYMKDVNAYWSQYDCVVYTTTITVGVNFSRAHFDTMYIFFSSMGSSVRDMIQASLRVRKLKNNTVFYCRNHRSKQKTDRWREFDRQKLTDTFEYWQRFFRKSGGKEMLDWVKRLWVLCQQETNVSSYQHPEMIEEYLSVCGTDLVYRDYGEVEKPVKYEVVPSYDSIPLISHQRFQELDEHIRTRMATSCEKMEYLKFMFATKVFTEGAGPEEWKQFYPNSGGVLEKMWNLRYEYGGYGEPKNSVFLGNLLQKLHWMKRLCEQLGIKHSHSVDEVISRETFDRFIPWIHEKLPKIRKVFGCIENDRVSNVKECCGALKSILGVWGFSELKAVRAQKRVKGVLTDVGGFKLSIRPTIRNKKTGELKYLNLFPHLKIEKPGKLMGYCLLD